MGANSNIQWCDDADSMTSGCDGCELWIPGQGKRDCYAGTYQEERLAKAFAKSHPELYSHNFSDVRTIPGRIIKAISRPDLRGKVRPDKPWIPPEYPRTIFLSHLSDAFSRDVSFEFLLKEVIQPVTSLAGRRHIYFWLTKQARRLELFDHWLAAQGIGWPKNIWPIVSVTGKATTWRIRHLIAVRAKYRGISYEPAFDGVDFSNLTWREEDGAMRYNAFSGEYWVRDNPTPVIYPPVNWFITGGMSRQNAHKEPAPYDCKWALSLVDGAKEYNRAVFVKQLGASPVYGPHINYGLNDGHNGDWDKWTGPFEKLRVREFPKLEGSVA
jgi:protein gp37